MANPSFLRVYIEVVTREDLKNPLSTENMFFELCEHLTQRTAVVQLHVVARTDSIAELAAGKDLIPSVDRLETQTVGPAPDPGHAAFLYFACSALTETDDLHGMS